ncbi:hypothetical protein [Burkholderia ubonensis]|uniref:Major capsid protein n=1 Tax=Burkholderia ubonensis TaxID=101571 RepID=A0ABD4E3L6_9BURK|nr:hypothetical protein [Burkholderia ubonensis]KVN83494.1 hypothetical protein WJ68_16415 [Burkholderia ubonensis]
MSGTQSKFNLKDQDELQSFVHDTVLNVGKAGEAVFDSASAASAASAALGGESGKTPAALSELLGIADDEGKIVKALFDGVRTYQNQHGMLPTGDVILSAVHQAHTLLDSATNSHHDQISLAPNAPVIAILGALAEACPFAGYLPADRGSNEARLIIVTHQAGSNFGDYNQGDLMDGIAQGGSYLSSSRTINLAAPNDTANYKFQFTAQTAGGNPNILLRGRSIVYVNGLVAATEVANGPSTAASVPIVGQIRLAGVDYALSGTVNPGTGTISITPTPAFPNGTVVTAESFIDYEADASVTPRMQVQAQTFQLFAAPYRALYQVTPESRSQFANEVGVDAGAEAMLSVRGQYSMERHYDALKKAKMIAKFQNNRTFDYQYSVQIQQKVRAQIWQDFASVLGLASQQMAEDTADHGITHLYVTKSVAAQFRSMPQELFVSSGIVDRPGIYRVGRLFGQFEVYYSPKVVTESADGTTAEILGVGRSTQTARCPIIMGDAQAPMFEQLGVTEALKSGYGFSARSFNAVNPHVMSTKGAALITVINLK